ncbi:MAG TPA: adenylosuccinate lyase [Candidatus Krumholzibacteria bacterium]|nr:adenylosuccinate lyase [Candidatus Krumholzibacteria bacterium]
MIERYQTPQMNAIWSDQRRLEIWREVEVAVCQAQAELGVISEEAAATIASKAGFELERVHEIEATVHHDVIAFLTNMAEHIGPDSRFVHLGMTSSDLLDTTLAVQCKEAGELLLAELDRLRQILIERAQEHRRTVMMGRSHGIHAEPTTLGLKLLVWVDELRRARRRLVAALETVSVGQISGPVGTFAHIRPEVEAAVCARLSLAVAPISTQIVQRDRHGEFMAALALLAASLEKFALEIRHLQRTEVHEVEEPFGSGQKGSSAMPHKKNPILCERIVGMARLVRGNLLAALEDVALWHERDISHSSVERVILPDSTTLVHYMLLKMSYVMEGLRVFPERMRQNLEQVPGIYHSGALLLELARVGMSREEAYSLVQECALKAWEGEAEFEELVRADECIVKHLDAKALDGVFDLERHLAQVDLLFSRVLAQE